MMMLITATLVSMKIPPENKDSCIPKDTASETYDKTPANCGLESMLLQLHLSPQYVILVSDQLDGSIITEEDGMSRINLGIVYKTWAQ